MPDTKGDYGEWNFGSERWFGFSLYFPTAGNAKWNNRVTRPILQNLGWGATVGDGASPILHFMLDNGGEVDIDTEFSVDAGDLTSAQDYLYTGGWVSDTNGNTLSGGAWETLKTYGSSGAAYHLKSAASATAERIQRDQWNDFVVHFKKGHTIVIGLIEVWLNGTKILDIPAFPTAPDDFWQSFVKSGLYGVRVDGGGTYTMYVDSYRATDETGDFDAVDPTQNRTPRAMKRIILALTLLVSGLAHAAVDVTAKPASGTYTFNGSWTGANSTPAPTSYYHFDEGSGTALTDIGTDGSYDISSFTGTPDWTTCSGVACLNFDGSTEWIDVAGGWGTAGSRPT